MRSFSSLLVLVVAARLCNAQVTFTDVSSTAGTGLGDATTRGISWIDYNNDGFQDLFVPTAGTVPNKLYRNNGNGTFTDVAASVGLNDSANTITCSWADYNNDGQIDLLTTATAAPVRLWRNTSGVFTDVTATAGISMTGAQMPAWADYNRDGLLDAYMSVSNSAASTDALYRNNGNGTFTNVADSTGVNHQASGILEQAVHWGDFDRDNDPDLFIGNLQTGGPSFFHRNNGNGTFTEAASTFGFQGAARGSQWVDYNNDGLWDFSAAGYAGGTATIPVKLYKNNGNGTFTDVAASAGITDAVISWGVTWADYDNNGFEDLFVCVSGQSTSCLLYKNNGDGTFTNVTAQAGLANLVQLSAAWGDYDRDGDMDLYTSGAGTAGNHLFRNNGDATKKWVEINLSAGAIVGNNRFGVGAQITVKAGRLRMMREVNTAIGYRSQNMMTTHFGLDTNSVIDSIIIRWPAGVSTIYTQLLSANRVMNLSEFPPLSVENLSQPNDLRLEQNYPNPFNPSTKLTFSIGTSAFASLTVFDVLGNKVATLVDEFMVSGLHERVFDGSQFSSGVYFYRLTAGGYVLTKKMILTK